MSTTITPPTDVTHNCLNYMTDGGDTLVIGGTLEIQEGASVSGLPACEVAAATADTLGTIKAAAKTEAETTEVKIGSDNKLYVPAIPIAEHQVDSTAASVSDLVTDFNTLLSKLKAAGLMAVPSE